MVGVRGCLCWCVVGVLFVVCDGFVVPFFQVCVVVVLFVYYVVFVIVADCAMRVLFVLCMSCLLCGLLLCWL